MLVIIQCHFEVEYIKKKDTVSILGNIEIRPLMVMESQKAYRNKQKNIAELKRENKIINGIESKGKVKNKKNNKSRMRNHKKNI